MVITFPYSFREESKEQTIDELARLGFFRVSHDGVVAPLDPSMLHGDTQLDVVADRFVFRPEDRKRCIDSIEQRFSMRGIEGEDNCRRTAMERCLFSSETD